MKLKGYGHHTHTHPNSQRLLLGATSGTLSSAESEAHLAFAGEWC